jgi:FemAB-related protein (PEP-CTERM system-associated)
MRIQEQLAVATPGPLTVATTVDDGTWDDFVASQPGASAYHRAGWGRLIARAFGHEARMLAVRDGDRVSGVLPLVIMRSRVFGRFVVSLPFLNAGGVLAADESSARALVEAAIEVSREVRADYLELRHTSRRCPDLSSRSHKVAMTLPLRDSVEAQWAVLDRKVRNQVRKGEKSQLTVRDGGLELVAPFYEVFSRNMRDLGTPVFGIALFEEAVRTFPGNSRVFSVYAGDRPVAGSIVHWRNGAMEVIWASALREFNAVCANPFLYWHMLQFAIGRGCATFDFGRCTPGEGTYQFKQQWGAEPHPLVWEYWSAGRPIREDLSPKSSTFSRASTVWRRLPVPLATMVGPRIVRSIPC